MTPKDIPDTDTDSIVPDTPDDAALAVFNLAESDRPEAPEEAPAETPFT